MIDLRILIKVVVSMEIMVKEMTISKIEDKVEVLLEVPHVVEVEDAVDLIRVQI